MDSMTQAEQTTDTDRPCPDPAHGDPASRIGNRRSSCRTCNAFARRLERAVSAALRADDPHRYRDLRESIERDLYEHLMKGTNS